MTKNDMTYRQLCDIVKKAVEDGTLVLSESGKACLNRWDASIDKKKEASANRKGVGVGAKQPIVDGIVADITALSADGSAKVAYQMKDIIPLSATCGANGIATSNKLRQYIALAVEQDKLVMIEDGKVKYYGLEGSVTSKSLEDKAKAEA